MKYVCVIFFSLTCATACSTPNVPTHTQKQAISLSSVESLQEGKTSVAQLKAVFAEPDQIIPFSTGYDIWSYNESSTNGEPLQRVNFVVNKKTGELESATWIPTESDVQHDLQSALDHFKNVHFEAKDIGWIAHHEYSDEAIYKDTARGISMRVNKRSHNVSAISFGPTKSGPIAAQD